ncbi:MAG: ferredoxin--NADP reductase [Bacteroidota bacterium]
MASDNITALNEHTISGNTEIAPDVYLISFKRRFDFIPGQVVKIGLDNDHPPRIYSICSGNRDPEISILFNVKKEGILTPRLAQLIPGDKILVSDPYGSFQGSNEPAWWIATGTGIAPFYSMFRSGFFTGKTLIHGVSYLNQFYFEDELEEAFEERYIRCCSRETSCNTYPGRVTDYISKVKEFPDVNYYLCGQAIMVVEVRDLLISKGVPFVNIEAEIYF